MPKKKQKPTGKDRKKLEARLKELASLLAAGKNPEADKEYSDILELLG